MDLRTTANAAFTGTVASSCSTSTTSSELALSDYVYYAKGAVTTYAALLGILDKGPVAAGYNSAGCTAYTSIATTTAVSPFDDCKSPTGDPNSYAVIYAYDDSTAGKTF